MIDIIKGFITGDSGIVVIILGLIITFATKRISKAIKGTALEGDLKDLLETTANAAKDGKLTGKEHRRRCSSFGHL